MEPEGLIFDCDGTLVDTMPIHFKAWSSTTKVHGLVFPEDRFYALGGVSPFEVLRILSSEQGVKVDPEAVTREKESRYMELIAEADEIPEVMQIVRENHGKIPMAVASGGTRNSRGYPRSLRYPALLRCHRHQRGCRKTQASAGYFSRGGPKNQRCAGEMPGV